MLNRYFLLISILFHLALFLKQNGPVHKFVIPAIKKSSIKIKKVQRSITKTSSRTNKNSNLSWNALSFAGNAHTGKIIKASYKSQLFEIIETAMVYPEEIASLGISGLVRAKIYINRKGEFIERHSYFKSNSKYLEICVRRILRRALLHNDLLTSHDQGVHDAIFEFDLTTALKKSLSKKSQIGGLFFYRRRYGVTNGIDKINKGVTEVLGTIMNPLSLLKYLPSAQKHKRNRVKRLIEKYQRDDYF